MQIIASDNNNTLVLEAEVSPILKNVDYNTKTTRPITNYNKATSIMTISGAIALDANHSIHAMELETSFWPDKSDESGFARLLTLEDKAGISDKE